VVARFRRNPQRQLEALADEELIARVADGDPKAFGVIYDRHSTAAYSLAYRISGRRSAADDVVQEAFLSLWRSAQRYDAQRGSVRTFILGIVHNRSIDGLRRATVHDSRRASDEGIEERFAAPERTDAEVARRDEAQTVRQALAELPGDQQKVIELAYFGGFSQSEIADMIDAPLGTVKGRMRLGLEKLRAALGEGAGAAWT
jgi:RNA polymerase sigma-70 factor (ECF subfamily)